MESSFSPLGACAPPFPHFLGSQVIVRTLLEQGVEVVFGYPGAAVMPLFDQFRKLQIKPHQQRGGASRPIAMPTRWRLIRQLALLGCCKINVTRYRRIR